MATHPVRACFAVRVSDSVVDAARSTAVVLHVHAASQTIHFVSSSSVKETYTYTDIVARPHSRAGLQFQIQQHDQQLTKLLTFHTSEERDQCVATLALMETGHANDVDHLDENVRSLSRSATSDEPDRVQNLDYATLDKLLQAEQNLFRAGQATLAAWKLINGDTDTESDHIQQQRESEMILSHLAAPNTGDAATPAHNCARRSLLGLSSRGDALAAPRSDVTLFHFTVRKSDSVLEMLGSKKATIQLQVDIETRMLSFISPHENRESYSCAAVTARPQSRLGMQLKIQTGTTSLTKKINFLSTEERANFIDALEQGKVMSKKGIPPFRGTESSMLSDDATVASLESSRVKPRESIMADNFTPLPGEAVLEHVQRVTNLVVMSQSDRAVQGVLKITTYRITFSPYDSSWKFGSFEVPLSALDVITRDGLMLLIACKDLRTIRLAMHDAYTKKKGYDQLPSTPDFRWLDAFVQRMRPPNMIGAVFAFDFFQEKKAQTRTRTEKREDGWLLYSPVAEYQRLGFLRGADLYNRKHDVDSNVITWRLLKNSKFRFSPTYPQLMVVPSLMTEEQLVQSARFRSRARLPVVVWRHPVNKCVLARSSQPNYGLLANRCDPDRILLKALRDAANKNSSGEAPPLHIIDARELIATKGNQAKGKGVENPQHYDNAVVEFVGISNMHKMRESFGALKNLIHTGGKNFYSRLESTKWLRHIGDILTGAARVVEILHEDRASVLVHCSDGWNRTPQIVSLAQLMLDPFYRTIRGFAILIEKEWCSFGHKFADRIGVGKDTTDETNERSPVMLQFLDCVWQIARQFPTVFEFNEAFLLHVWDALLSGLYGTFLYNNERERIFEKVWERTESAWTPVLQDMEAFTNPKFKATDSILDPRVDEASIVLWEALMFRWDPDRRGRRNDSYSLHTTETGGFGATQPFEATDEVNVVYRSNQEDAVAPETPFQAKSSAQHCRPDDCQPAKVSVDSTTASDQYARGVKERARYRAQARNIREAITMAPDTSRIKYLEQLLSESFAREVALETELGDAQRLGGQQ